MLFDKNNIEIQKKIKYIIPVLVRHKNDGMERKKIGAVDYNELLRLCNLNQRYIAIDCVSKSYYEYFENMEYVGEVINERRLSINDLMGDFNYLINKP